MHCIENSFINTPTIFNKALVGFTTTSAITTIAITMIGLIASTGGPFNAIVSLGSTTNGILLGTSIFVFILDLFWIAALCKKAKESLLPYEAHRIPQIQNETIYCNEEYSTPLQPTAHDKTPPPAKMRLTPF